jgi:dihydrofolate reductase
MIRHIVAIDREYGMAKNGGLPWKIPEDEQYFTDKTKEYGGVTLTGRATYDTFGGKPLEGRQNFVVTHRDEPIHGATIVHDIDTFFKEHPEDVWVVGGSEIFRQTLSKTDELYVTRVDAMFACDRFYPKFEDDFELASQGEWREQNGFRFRYEVYKRKSA